MSALRIGTSGWNYPTGKGTWNGLFYPATRSKKAGTAGFDELRFYAEHFDTVEVNSTFYGQPRAEVTAGWAARTPPGFEFSLKLYQKFTHPKMFREAALTSAPGPEGALLDLLAQVTRSDLDGEELRALAETAGAARELVKKAYLYTNNHFSAKSVVNAVMLKAQLGEPIEGEYPPQLVDRYPEIRDLVTTSPAVATPLVTLRPSR